jgi:hypothetical protein
MRDLGWPVEEFALWLRTLVPIGLTDLGCDVVAGASQSIINPRTRTRQPTRVRTRRHMGLSPVVNGWQIEYANRYGPFQDPASPNMID